MTKTTTAKGAQLWIGILISLCAVSWLVFSVEWSEVWGILLTLKLAPFLGLFAIFLLHFALRSMRWRYLLPAGSPLPFRNLWDAIMVGNFASFVLPLRAGEFIRPYFLSRFVQVGFPAAFASVVTERFFDLSMVLLAFGIFVAGLSDIPHWVHQGAHSLTVLAALILAFMVFVAAFPLLSDRFIRWGLSLLPGRVREVLNPIAEEFVKGIRAVGTLKKLFIVISYSCAIWFTTFLFFDLSFDLFPRGGSLEEAIVVAVLVALAVAAPSAPGFIGVYQIGCICAFALFGAERELATAYAIVTHLFQYIFICIAGAISLARSGLTLGRLRGGALPG